jgi:hypothetical protein
MSNVVWRQPGTAADDHDMNAQLTGDNRCPEETAMRSMPSCLAGRGRVPYLDGPVPLWQLNKMGPWTGRERLRFLWYRLRLTVAEMNYATRRLVELQMRAPAIRGETRVASAAARSRRSQRPANP